MGTDTRRPFTVAAIQAEPVLLDRAATTERACEWIADAGQAGARFAVFPAAFIPGYPEWVWTIPASETRRHRELRAALLASAVTVPGEQIDRLCQIARRARVNVAIGVTERAADGAALYNTILHIDERGELIGRHRALTLASAERLVWTAGDGDTFGASRYPFGIVGGLVGREHYLPLARHALYTWGVRVYLGLGREVGAAWLATLQHIAREGQALVIGCGGLLRGEQLSAAIGPALPHPATWVQRGGSAIVAPDGAIIAGPSYDREGPLAATLDPDWLIGAADAPGLIGPDARGDIFKLRIKRAGRGQPAAGEGPGAQTGADHAAMPRLGL